jgi:uroporphyrinogen decarboxylase
VGESWVLPRSEVEHGAAVEHPGLVVIGAIGGKARDLVVGLERREQRRAYERVREARMPSAPRCVGGELRRTSSSQPSAAQLDRTPDCRVPLRMQLRHVIAPVGRRLDAFGEERARRGRVSRQHVDRLLPWGVPELGEPEAMLLDEIHRQQVTTGRNRATQVHSLLQRLPRGDVALERRPSSVPDDRVAALVEPVVGEEEPVVSAACAPGGAAGVLHLDGRRLQRTGLDLVVLERAPPDDERARGSHGHYCRLVEPLLVRVLRREPAERTPVWFMRQAGRSLPEYRAIRQRYGFFEVAGTPELCAEVTLQPVRRHGVDAAVLFADIMSPVLGMGVEVELVEGVGPVVDRPIASSADVARLRVSEAEEWAGPILEAVRLVRAELEPERAVVGFCGGPFTVAGYLVEGRPSRDFVRTKALMYRKPEVWHALLDRLADQFGRYVAAKASAGADAIQLFDSWVGVLSPRDYVEFVAPYSRRVLEAVRIPTIHFGTGASSALLGEMARLGGDAIGLDWRTPLDAGWVAVGDCTAVQGNLDPAVLLGPWEGVERAALDVLARAGGRPGHVFNLGHGVLPQTEPETLTRLAALVQERTAEARR